MSDTWLAFLTGIAVGNFGTFILAACAVSLADWRAAALEAEAFDVELERARRRQEDAR